MENAVWKFNGFWRISGCCGWSVVHSRAPPPHPTLSPAAGEREIVLRAFTLKGGELFAFWGGRVFTHELKMADAQEFLADYARNGSESAFRELVERYVSFVHSTAARLVRGDAQLAEDVAQTVFVDLARMAGRLPGDVLLGGWLHRHTCFVAAKAMRGELRRQARERQAMELKALNERPDAALAEIAPMLDEAINKLDAQDRLAVLLRFFERRDFRAVGAALGISEDAARMRVNRALEKLHSSLRSYGLTCSAGALGNSLTLHAVTAAPTGLAAALAGQALAVATGAGAGLAASLLRLLASSKMKVGLVSFGSAFVVVVAVHSHFTERKEAEKSAAATDGPALEARPGSTAFAKLQARVAASASQPPAPLPAAASIAVQPGLGAAEIYGMLSGRTVLHGPLPKLSESLASRMQADPVEAAALLERELSGLGYSCIPDGQKFVRIIAAADKDKPRTNPPPRNPQSARVAPNDEETNTLSFPGMDLNTFLDVYAGVAGRTILRAANLQSPPLQLVSVTPLTSGELVYAMGVVLQLNGLAVIADGDKFIQLVRQDEASTVQTNAPKSPPGARAIARSEVPVLPSASPLRASAPRPTPIGFGRNPVPTPRPGHAGRFDEILRERGAEIFRVFGVVAERARRRLSSSDPPDPRGSSLRHRKDARLERTGHRERGRARDPSWGKDEGRMMNDERNLRFGIYD